MSRQETISGASNSQAPQNTIFIRTPLHPHHLPKLGWKDAQCLLALASHNLPPAHPRRDATVHWHVDAQQATVHTSRTLRPFVCRTLATCCPSSGSGRESSNAARTCFRYLLLRFTPDMVVYGNRKKVGTAGEMKWVLLHRCSQTEALEPRAIAVCRFWPSWWHCSDSGVRTIFIDHPPPTSPRSRSKPQHATI